MSKNNKIIFLDVDGVLNDGFTKSRTPSGCVGVMDSKVKLIKKIVDATGAKIVLSSDWRLMDEDGLDYQYLLKKLSKYGLKIFDKTPDMDWRERWREVSAWLDSHNVGAWVAIDDIPILYETTDDSFNGHVVITDGTYGINNLDVDTAIKILGV